MEPLPGATAVAAGNFDGVHLGHREVIGRMVVHSRSSGLSPAVLTFRPHPARLLASGYAPPLITPYNDRNALLASLGPEFVVEQAFDEAFAAMDAASFVKGYLRGLVGARAIFVGYDFTFGRGRDGTVETLRELCRAAGMYVEVVPQVRVAGMVASSTKIREFLHEGNLAGATKLLGRPYSIRGTVVKGFGRGRGLGFPTANLEGGWEILPPDGVYATVLVVDGAQQASVTNIGRNPTFGAVRRTVEIYVMDYSGDLYGRSLELGFIERLRSEERFSSPDELRVRIAADVKSARDILGKARGQA
jgi:riboflavin kinase/FMN adenylyltransferase